MTTKMKTTKATDAKTSTTAGVTPATSIERVTPAMAAEMLSKNTRNRVLNQSRVIAMSEDMVAGQWRVTHQGVAIAADGTLLDGQHRLTAVTLANVAVNMMVTRGLAPESVDAIDTGENRRAHDVLAIADGVHLTTRQRAVASTAHALSQHGTLNVRPRRLTVGMLRAALAEHGDDMAAVLDSMGPAHDRLSNASMVGSLVCAYRTHPGKTLEFCRLMRSGAGMDEGHPVLALRNFVLVQYVSGGGAQREDLSLRTFAAFDAFLRGHSRLFIRGGEKIRAKYLAPWRKDESKD